MFKTILQMIVILIAAGSSSLAFAVSNPIHWQSIAPGLAYTQVILPDSAIAFGKLHAFQIDLTKYQLNLVFASDYNQAASSVKTLTRKKQGILGINGGFFEPNFQPLGLRIQANQERVPLKPISWWGVFYIQNNKPHIVSQLRFRSNKNISFAVQAGPRLLINGRIPSLKQGQSQRSLMCITRDQKLVIAATDYSLITTTSLAQVLQRSNKQGGLGCVNALNLDGGSSTQLYADLDRFQLDISHHQRVSDAIVVTKRLN